MAPYLHLAKAVGEEEDFFSTFFKVWFERWPETPTDNSDGGISSVEDMKEIVKKVCITCNVLTVVILTCYIFNRRLREIIDSF
jgi:hypothetical protein